MRQRRISVGNLIELLVVTIIKQFPIYLIEIAHWETNSL